jgi:hypothetical protein
VEDGGLDVSGYGLYEMVRYNGSFNTFNEPIESRRGNRMEFWRNI